MTSTSAPWRLCPGVCFLHVLPRLQALEAYFSVVITQDDVEREF